MKSVRAYKYRWLILISMMLLMLSVEIPWMSLAPVARAAEVYYAGQYEPSNTFNIDFLSLSYMVIFVLASIPAAYLIDRLGIVKCLRAAAAIIAVGSLTKWFLAPSYPAMASGQILLALAQPLVINSVTTVVARWFPLRERGFAVGLVAFSQYAALLLVMIISPLLVGTNFGQSDYGSGIDRLMMVYGIACAVMAVGGAFMIHEKPPTPSSYEPVEPIKFWKSNKMIFHNRSLLSLMIVYGLGWAFLITLIIKIDSLSAFSGFPNSNAILGIIVMVSGLAGALVVPFLSDVLRRRKLMMLICVIGILPGGILLTFCNELSFWVFSPRVMAMIGGGISGFFLMGAGPLGHQYAAELNPNIPESVTQSMMMLISEFFGVVMLVFASIKNGAFLFGEMVTILCVCVVSVVIVATLKESPVIITEDERLQQAVKKEIVYLQ